MRHRTILALTGATACVVALAGCSTTSQGQPQPQVTGTSESTTLETSESSAPRSTSPDNGALPTDGAPKVENPLDTRRFQQNPCEALSTAQLQQLNLPAQGEQRQGPLGLECKWFNRENGGTTAIQWADKFPLGLSAVYKANKAGKYKYFNEVPEIEGFPAVSANVVDARDQGACPVQVGVSDETTFDVDIQLSLRNIGQKDPCEVAAQVAGMILKTMKAGG